MFSTYSALALLALTSSSFAQTVPKPRHRPNYDYIVLGGGTSGLVVANRLSEDPDVTVAVVEAGDSVLHNYNVSQISNWFINLGSAVDWQYPILPQGSAPNRTLVYDQGKALAGTSAINGGTYIRAERAQIDSWEKLGNTGWNWDSLFPYYKKSEHFQKPGPELVAKGVEFEPAVHGCCGPLDVGWSNYTMGGDAHEVVNQTWQALGLPYNRDQSDGSLHGFSIFPSTANTKTETRADAARSYYWPISGRKNLDVYVNTVAEKLLWDDSECDRGPRRDVTAHDVQVRPIAGGDAYTLRARREIIVSLGSLKSPVFLEQSGIGNPEILKKHDIPVRVALKSIGENLQDQPLVAISAAAETNYSGYPPYAGYSTAADLFGDNVTAVESYIESKIPAYASIIAAQSNQAFSRSVVERQLRIQADLIFNQGTPIGENLVVPSKDSILIVQWLLLPFSRGNVHMSSTNASSAPLINPNFLLKDIDWDAMAMTALLNYDRDFLHTDPIAQMVGEMTLPDSTTVPLQNAGVAEWLPYIESGYNPNSHPIGTCAMMSRELGGVVSPQLVVYGTSNVRVVDASVLPFEIDAHLTSTLYAIAERASDMIKEERRSSHHHHGHE